MNNFTTSTNYKTGKVTNSPLLPQEAYYEEILQYRNSCIVKYYQYIGERRPPKKMFGSNTEDEQQAYTGEFTPSAKKKLNKTIDVLLQSTRATYKKHPVSKKRVKHHLSIITLTISNERIIHPNEAYNKLLKPFLQYLQKTKEVTKYIWKLEFQSNTNYKGLKKKYGGQIHYHITFPNVIHWREIRNKWNYIQKKAGLLEQYYSIHQHYDPNSTDIHKVYKIKNIQSYLAKEFCKSQQQVNPNKNNYTKEYENISYKFWDCSKSLKGLKFYNEIMTDENTIMLIKHIEKNVKLDKIKYLEQCTIIPLQRARLVDTLPLESKRKYNQFVSSINTKKCNTQIEFQ